MMIQQKLIQRNAKALIMNEEAKSFNTNEQLQRILVKIDNRQRAKGLRNIKPIGISAYENDKARMEFEESQAICLRRNRGYY